MDAKLSWILRDADNGTVTSQPFGIPFLLATERAFARIRNVTVDHVPDGTLFPTPVQQYDSWVLREALHNAVAHQDYQLGGKINLVEHPDRLVLTNLGQFMQGQILDPKFARALMARSDLTLGQVLLRDRVQKGRTLAFDEARTLRAMGLIEGRSPRFFISAKVAETVGQKASYLHNRGLDDKYCQRLVLDYLERYGRAARADLDALLLPKLPDVLDAGQKANKVKNLLQGMRRSGTVHTVGPRSAALWHLGSGAGGAPLDK